MASLIKRVRLGSRGHVTVPADFRRQLGIEAGDDLFVSIQHGRLVFRRRDDVEQELWDLVSHVKVSMSEELIRERRREATREP